MDEQQKVAAFLETYELNADPSFRILDLASEVGEIAKDANESTNYGASPESIDVKTDELGDALFSLLAVAESLDVDAGEALNEALEKYRARLDESDVPSSGE